MKRTTLLAPLLCLALGACPLGDDPGFDDWCGDSLCHWTLVDGSIKKVPTWHDRDYGVELDGAHVTLTQRPNISSLSCLEFKVIADIDPAAAVFIELDFRADGSVEYREQIPSARWEPLTFLVAAPTWYDALELRVTKESDGHAVLARLEIGDGRRLVRGPRPVHVGHLRAFDDLLDDVCGVRRQHAVRRRRRAVRRLAGHLPVTAH
jgi:hypothetical protein